MKTIEEHIKTAMQDCPLTDRQENALLNGIKNYLNELEQVNKITSKQPVISSVCQCDNPIYMIGRKPRKCQRCGKKVINRGFADALLHATIKMRKPRNNKPTGEATSY